MFEILIQSALPLGTCIGAFVITYLVIPVIIDVSHTKHLFDDPEEARKLHTDKTPNLGGIAIFSGVSVAFLLSGYATAQWVPFVLAGLILLFFSGIKDDIMVIAPLKKLGLQVLAITAPILGGGLAITNLGGVFGQEVIPLWAGVLLTFFTMVVVVNAYNLIDGIDGLAGGVGAIVSLFFGAWFWSVGLYPEAVLAFTLMGSLLGFLWYNMEPASIFMGDTGSQIVGYLLAFLAVRFVDFGITAEVAVPFKNEVPVLILAVLIVPLYDTLRVFMIRLIKGRSPFSADRLHVHHQLIDAGFSHMTSSLIIYGLNIAIIGAAMFMAGNDVNIIFAGILLMAVTLFPTKGFKRKLLKLVGIQMPSARYINVIERKYGITEKTIGKKVNVQGDELFEVDPKEIDIGRDKNRRKQEREYDYDKVANA
ncbi:glycosyltransferase family 4 protein [Halalkalibaculum sp. DA3122]|uniref:glycosyltransferase family 4 protein n=1 Tax=Halalkalibaculum sp. DA3122 TaxID=3373607 RepID=UPI003754E082